MTSETTVGELARIDSGYAFKSSEWLPSGIPVVKIRNIKDGIVSLDDCAFVSESSAQRASDFRAESGGILISLTGYVGQVGRVRLNETVYVNQRVGFVRPNNAIDSDYIYYLLRYLRVQIEELGTGTAQANVAPKDIMKLSIPSLTTESRLVVGNFLRKLDEKIEVNNAVSRTLEDVAQAIFKSWFIDFDPVKAKMAGEKPAGMDDATAALFPDSMEDSELGLIPKGWKSETIKDVCDSLVNGSTPLRTNSTFWDSEDIPWYKTGELADGFLFNSKEAISKIALEKTSVKMLPKGGVLMAIYAAPTVGRLGILTKNSTFNQACTGMVAKDNFGFPFLYLTLFNRRVWFNSLAIGAAQQNISKVIVEGCPAITASQDLHNAFLKIVQPIFDQLESIGNQTNSLILIRDSLLPRLISGELQIPEEMLAS
jgi:type I restriction enzyme S subunit